MTYITEAETFDKWVARATELTGPRAFWVQLVSGTSKAKPSIVGFYASSINAACDQLAN